MSSSVEVRLVEVDRDVASVGYREIDQQLRSIAKRRAALDSEEARWLREAEAQQIWRKLGFSTSLEYLEDVFFYAPRTALERLRVAKELGQLQELDAKLRAGEIGYGAARELSRVMTTHTQRAWLMAAQGRNLREIEKLVRGRKKGDDPTDPADERIVEREVILRLTPAVEALLRQTRADLSDECGHRLEDGELIELLCRRARDGGARGEGVPPPAYQTSIRTCDRCVAAEQLAGGEFVPIDRAARAVAECDAVLLGDETDAGLRASRTIPKRIRELVWLRDEGRCRVPGCRATRNCDIHHVVAWADGGGHEASNLIVVCSGHHRLLHEGQLTISGSAPDALTFERNGKRLLDPKAPAERGEQLAKCEPVEHKRTHADRHRFADVAAFVEAKAALRQLGYKARAAAEALERVRTEIGDGADVASIVRAVLAADRRTVATPSTAHALDEHAARTSGSAQPTGDRGWTSLVRDHERMARQALVQSGYSSRVAQRSVERARGELPDDAELATLIKLALRYCLDG